MNSIPAFIRVVYVYMEGPDSVPVDGYVDSTSHYSLLGVNTDIVIYEAFSIYFRDGERDMNFTYC